jgi:5-hydroxyisourate hydrolase
MRSYAAKKTKNVLHKSVYNSQCIQLSREHQLTPTSLNNGANPSSNGKSNGKLSTHVLDTMHGCPAAGMSVTLFCKQTSSEWMLLKSFVLNADGRNDGGPLLTADTIAVGQYRLIFEVAAYFRSKGVLLPEPAFLDSVSIDFGIADSTAGYHVPLLVSPWSYSTYRGS